MIEVKSEWKYLKTLKKSKTNQKEFYARKKIERRIEKNEEVWLVLPIRNKAKTKEKKYQKVFEIERDSESFVDHARKWKESQRKVSKMYEQWGEIWNFGREFNSTKFI